MPQELGTPPPGMDPFIGQFNPLHKGVGHLFTGLQKALMFRWSRNGYFKMVLDYVQLNPERARIPAPAQASWDFEWCSWPDHLAAPGGRPPWLQLVPLLGEYEVPKDSPAARRELEAALEQRRAGEAGMNYRQLPRGWCFGGDTFKQELLAQMSGGVGPEHFGPERRESAETRAETIVTEELRWRGWNQQALEQRAKGNAEKVLIAARLRAETAVPVSWIAKRLAMGATGYVAHLLYRYRQGQNRLGGMVQK